MTVQIVDLFQHPVKGARGTSLSKLHIRKGVGVVGDRTMAILKPDKEDSDPLSWSPKRDFLTCFNTPAMAITDIDPVLLAALDQDHIRRIRWEMSLEESSAIKIKKGTDSFNLCDVEGTVSFLNVASVYALETHMRRAPRTLNPVRFRMNVHLTGLAAFEELALVGREISFGDCHFKVTAPCTRCKAIEASPDTGRYESGIIRALVELMKPHRYSAVMGILATPLNDGVLDSRDTMKIH